MCLCPIRQVRPVGPVLFLQPRSAARTRHGVDEDLSLVERRLGQVTVMERDAAAELCRCRGMAEMTVKRGVWTMQKREATSF